MTQGRAWSSEVCLEETQVVQNGGDTRAPDEGVGREELRKMSFSKI